MALLFCLLLWATPVFALKAGIRCSDCHTMHHSQGGQALSSWGDAGPYSALLVTDCVGCHSGSNAPGSMPYVMSSAAPVYGATGTEANTNTLAGGSFYWVAQALGDSRGHNVVGLTAPDASLSSPPGFDGLNAAADGSVPAGGNWPAGQQVTCAGVYGCHGSHSESAAETAIRGGHHADLKGAITAPGTAAADSYRMLVGVAGFEDPEWELTPTATAHNQYKALDQVDDNSTISSLCIRCHGTFHQQAGLNIWTKHPVNYDLSNTAMGSEYRAYGGLTRTYQTAVPLGSTSVNAPLGNIALQGSDAVITCVSCHRAHGSPYIKLLRWDYAGSRGDGCVLCHTAKN
ncbi:MAG TPA: cytochrome c3 family protein [Malonomonas sp.]